MYSSRGLERKPIDDRYPFERHPGKEIWEALIKPFDVQSIIEEPVSPSDRFDKVTVLRPVLERISILDRLEEVLGPEGFQVRYDVASVHPPVVVCHLTIGKAVRAGIGEGAALNRAEDVALMNAAAAFHIGEYLQIHYSAKVSQSVHNHSGGVEAYLDRSEDERSEE